MHATAYLSKPDDAARAPVVVMHGEESHLKQAALKALIQRVLAGEDADFNCSRHSGEEVEFKAVRDELLTVSMFSTARVVVVEEADDFVQRNRAALEDYLERPARASVLVLDVKSWPKNTRLAKRLPAVGLELECTELTGGALHKWLADELASRCSKQLSRDAAALLVELAGNSLGLLAQELDKLAAYAGQRDRITIDDVRAIVGGWKAETTWEMLNAVRDGRPDAALAALDKLLRAGEPAVKLLGGINYVYRKLAEATERSRGGANLRAALQSANVFRSEIDAAERYLRRIGRSRAEQILTLLTTADAGLKGGSRMSERLQLEHLLLALSGAIPTA